MSLLSWIHTGFGLLAMLVGLAIFALPKGSRRHRPLGWIYVVSMLVSLAGILIKTADRPAPFAGYALAMALALVLAVAALRLRPRHPESRPWHAALMSLTMLGAGMAVGSIVGGALMDASSGAAFYRVFNLVIVAVTAAGLALIHSRSTIWGRAPGAGTRRARARFTVVAAVLSAALFCAQLPLALNG